MNQFLQFLLAPLRSMGALRIVFAAVPALLATFTFFGIHNTMLQSLGLRLTEEEEFALLLDAAACGDLVVLPGTGLVERKTCRPPQEFEFLYVIPTEDWQVWTVAFHYNRMRGDCASLSYVLNFRFADGAQRALIDLDRGEGTPYSIPVQERTGWWRRYTGKFKLPDRTVAEYGGEVPVGAQWDQTFSCIDGTTRRVSPGNNETFPVTVSRHHIWREPSTITP